MDSRRQCLVARSLASGSPTSAVFAAERAYLIHRFKCWPDDGIFDLGDTIRIQAEGELLYSGLAVDICALFVPTGSFGGGTPSTNPVHGPYVLPFDAPLVWDPDYPIEIEISAEAVTFIIEGVHV